MRKVEETVLGLVTRAVGGVFTVQAESGEVYTCRSRGRFRNEGVRILPGDRVRMRILGTRDGVIEEVLERRSLIKRPYIANVDQVIAVMSLDEPPPSLDLLDRILVLAHWESLDTVIVWNKADRVAPSDVERMLEPYRTEGFENVVTSCVTQVGQEHLERLLADRISVLAGGSGVGKSSLANILVPQARFQVGEVSAKLMRGRHTTRTVELVALPGGGWLADAPGFSVLDLAEIPKEALPRLYKSWDELSERCRFNGCLHRDEPECGVKAAVEQGRIDAGRYRRYIQILDALVEAEARRY